jgi:hypothetical protein
MPASTDPADVISDVLQALVTGATEDAANTISVRYPFQPTVRAERRYSTKQMLDVFMRDGFVDRYSGSRLVFPGALRLISNAMPSEFPFHKNWKVSETHPAFWQLCPTIDHIEPVARGGTNDIDNLVTTSQLKNSVKANWTLAELGWVLLPPGDMEVWDGLTGSFLRMVQMRPELLDDGYIRMWHKALTGLRVD